MSIFIRVKKKPDHASIILIDKGKYLLFVFMLMTMESALVSINLNDKGTSFKRSQFLSVFILTKKEPTPVSINLNDKGTSYKRSQFLSVLILIKKEPTPVSINLNDKATNQTWNLSQASQACLCKVFGMG